MWVSSEANSAEGKPTGWMYSTEQNLDVVAPTQLPSNKWKSGKRSTLGLQYTLAGGTGVMKEAGFWVDVPGMRVTGVHGLDDAEPAMAAELRQLAALTAAK
jgi:hypothetical protein